MTKGSIFDVLIIGITMLVLAIGILIASVVGTQVQASTADTLSSVEAQYALSQGIAAVNTFNYGYVIIAVGLGIGAVIFAWMVPTHPIFIIVSVIMLMISIIVLPQFSNVFETMSAESTMAGAAATFPLVALLMGNLPLIGVVFGVLLIIVMYTRWQNSGQS